MAMMNKYVLNQKKEQQTTSFLLIECSIFGPYSSELTFPFYLAN